MKFMIKKEANYEIKEVDDERAKELGDKGALIFDSREEADKWIWEKLKESKKKDEDVFDRLRKRTEGK